MKLMALTKLEIILVIVSIEDQYLFTHCLEHISSPHKVFFVLCTTGQHWGKNSVRLMLKCVNKRAFPEKTVGVLEETF
jgi:hypothetical protein